MKITGVLFVVMISLTSCKDKEDVYVNKNLPVTNIPPSPQKPLPAVPETPTTTDSAEISDFSYLALGDSYTIGQSVSKDERYPNQLLVALGKDTAKTMLDNIAITGWTTGELLYGFSAIKPTKRYDLVTLLIGVNNQYRGHSQEEYRKEFVQLLDSALKYAGDIKRHVYVLSIPDWGVTSFGKPYNQNLRVSKEIDQFNAINREETMRAGITYIDITPISRRAYNDPSLIASDGLHPSGKMYAEWVELLLERIKATY